MLQAALQRWRQFEVGDLPALLVDLLLVSLALWHLHVQVAMRLQGSFDGLMRWAWLPVLLTPLAVFWLFESKQEQPGPPEPGPSPIPPVLLPVSLGVALLAIGGMLAGVVPARAVWMLTLLHVGWMVLFTPVRRMVVAVRASLLDLGLLVLAALMSMLAYRYIHKPDNDDAYYLNAVTAHLRWSDLPILSFDGMHGDPSLPISQIVHRGASYELLVAAFARVLPVGPMGHWDLYYQVLPLLFAALIPVASWLLARCLVRPEIARLVPFLAIAMQVDWGGHWQCYGNNTLPRLFQGKGVFVALVAPLIVYSGLRFASAADTRSWARLTLAQLAAACTTSSALALAPIVAALAVLAALTPDRRGLHLSYAGLASALPTVALLLLLRADTGGLENVAITGKLLGINAVLGDGPRVAFLLALATGAPLVLWRLQEQGQGWLARYLAILWVVLGSGYLGQTLAHHGGSLFSWRVYWAVPMPQLFAIALAAGGYAALKRSASLEGLGWAVAVLVPMVAFVEIGPAVFQKANRGTWQALRWKVRVHDFAAAKEVVEHVGPDGMVLAHGQVAGRITGFLDAPKLVAIRSLYIKSHVGRGYDGREARFRHRLIDFVEADENRPDAAFMLGQIDARCVEGLVLEKKAHRNRKKLSPGLLERGFTLSRHGRLNVWLRDAQPCREP